MKTANDLMELLRETVPVLVYQYLLSSGSVRQCGTISDAFGTLAHGRGFDVYVRSVPGHFLNVVRTADGVFEVDLSAIQFEFNTHTDNERAEVRRLLGIIGADPFRAIRVRRLQAMPLDIRLPPEENAACLYEPVAAYRLAEKDARRLERGEFDDDFDSAVKRYLHGRPYGHDRHEHVLRAVEEELLKSKRT